MTSKTHVSIGVATALPLVTIYSYNSCYLMVALLGAITPDFDIMLNIKHRTWTHSILLLCISTLIIINYDKTIALFWFVGYSTHLISDSFTKMGVPFLYPFIKDKYGLKLCRTGGVLDIILGYSALGIILYFAYKYLFNVMMLI